MLTVAQIGCGAFAASQDLPNFQAHGQTQVKWCCDTDLGQAEALAAAFGVPHATADLEAVMADPEVDFVKVATSHEAHLPIIRAAAAHGKHVFCEKPLAMDPTEALAIVRVVRQGGIKLCVDLNRRLAPALQALRQRWQRHLAAPEYPPWRYVEAARELLPEEERTQLLIRIQDESASYRLVHLDPQRGGGLLLGESVHWFDLMGWFFAPQLPVELLAWGSARLSHGVHVTFAAGDTATLVFSCGGTFDYPKELYEVAARGVLLRSRFFVENEYYGLPQPERQVFPLQRDPFPDMDADTGFAGYMARYQRRVRSLAGSSRDGHAELAVDKGHRHMLAGFVDAIVHDRPSPCDELAGYTSVLLAHLARRSLELRQAVPVPVDSLRPVLV